MIFIITDENHAKADAIAPTTERLKAHPESLTKIRLS